MVVQYLGGGKVLGIFKPSSVGYGSRASTMLVGSCIEIAQPSATDLIDCTWILFDGFYQPERCYLAGHGLAFPLAKQESAWKQ